MIYRCNVPGCDFSAFNEKALELHKKEKHKVATPPSPQNQNQIKEDTAISLGTSGVPDIKQPENPQETPSKKPQTPHPGFNFLIDLKGKKVSVEGINGKTVTGVLKRFNQYELNLDTEDGNRTLFKHALFMIWEHKKEEVEVN